MTVPSTSELPEGRATDRIDTTVVHPARRYNYWLGGKDNFAVDRESGDQIAAVYPGVRTLAQENRAFLRRAVRFLTEESDVRQFLDIGTGIPSADNTHEVAQSIAPESRVVYVDNDPMVLVHARALLTSDPAGATAYLDADLRDPEKILADPQLHATLDLSRPVALVLVAVTHFLTDDDRPHEQVARLLDALPSGSWLVLTHITMDHIPSAIIERMTAEIASGRMKRMKQDAVPRDRAEFARFFTGLDLAEPGIVPVTEWRPQVPPEQRPPLADASIYGAVARKP